MSVEDPYWRMVGKRGTVTNTGPFKGYECFVRQTLPAGELLVQLQATLKDIRLPFNEVLLQ